jgi:hypothetical protein
MRSQSLRAESDLDFGLLGSTFHICLALATGQLLNLFFQGKHVPFESGYGLNGIETTPFLAVRFRREPLSSQHELFRFLAMTRHLVVLLLDLPLCYGQSVAFAWLGCCVWC